MKLPISDRLLACASFVKRGDRVIVCHVSRGDLGHVIIPPEELYALTGTQTMRINTLYQLYYLAKYRPELIERCDKILFTPDLMAYLLTGKMRAEKTIASTSNFLDPRTREFSTELLDKLGIPTSILPEMIEPGEVYGTLTDGICEELGCDKIPVVVPKVGVIKIGKEEIDLIVKYIKEA